MPMPTYKAPIEKNSMEMEGGAVLVKVDGKKMKQAGMNVNMHEHM